MDNAQLAERFKKLLVDWEPDDVEQLALDRIKLELGDDASTAIKTCFKVSYGKGIMSTLESLVQLKDEFSDIGRGGLH